MSFVISGTTHIGVTLVAADNPVSITSTALLDNSTSGNYALYGPGNATYTIFNAAIALAGNENGVQLKGSGTVTNSSLIQGKNGTGIAIAANGGVTNQASGVITGGVHGIIFGGGGTVSNAGNVLAISGNAVWFRGSGGGDGVTNQSGGVMDGGAYGVYSAGPGSVTNAGVIVGTSKNGIRFANGGSVTNQSTGTISGNTGDYVGGAAATVTNAGSISASGTAGVNFVAGGVVTNQTGGTISGGTYGVDALNAAATVTNSGFISGTQEGVGLVQGGTVNNLVGGTITGGYGVEVFNAVSTVTNAGGIAGTTIDGVAFFVGGIVSQLSSGAAISGASVGVYFGAGTGTVITGGTISGAGGTAVALYRDHANLVEILPGAVFNGKVNGGNPLGAATASTLELATGAATGTITGVGSKYIDFANIEVASGASWVLGAGNTIAAGYSLTDSGTLTNLGSISGAGTTGNAVVVQAGASLINAGTIANGTHAVYLPNGGFVSNAANGTITFGELVGIKDAGAAGTVVNAGLITSGATSNGSAGIILEAGGSVTNQAGGTISSAYGPVDSNTVAISIFNAGVMIASGPGAAAVGLGAGGLVSNASSGRITGGKYGVSVVGGGGTVTNAGQIIGTTGPGVTFGGGGIVTVASGGTISGGSYGVTIAGGAGTVVAIGTIIGAGGTAVALGNGSANRVDVYPGAVFTGKVNGGTSSSTLELASAASTGAITGFGSQYLNFGRIALDVGASWTVGGTIPAGTTIAFGAANSGTLAFGTPRSVGGTITGFGVGDVVALNGITDATGVTISSGNTLTVSETGGGSVTLKFDPAQSFTAETFSETTVGSATDITLGTGTVTTNVPVIAVTSGITVAVGGTGTTTSAALLATESGDAPAQLTYTVSTPADGVVQNKGTTVTTFTQADINAGSITYQENGTAATSDKIAFRVTDQNNGSVAGSFPVTITTPVSTAKPVLAVNAGVTVAVAGSAQISSAVLLTTETGDAAAQLVYSVTSGPSDGVLTKNGVATTTFTQADINAGSISYMQENGDAATSDAIAFKVTDPNGNSVIGTLPITISLSFTIPPQTGPGLLSTLSVGAQLELVYVAYFNRAADGAGDGFWGGQNIKAQSGGQSAAAALTNIANSFAPQAETEALYPTLDAYLGANPPPLNSAAGQSAVTTFVDAVYVNLFAHAADTPGQNYWVGQITTGAVGLGAAALAIANGATGSDAIEVQNKLTVALDFTSKTTAAGLGPVGPAPGGFLTAARNALSAVDGIALNDASVTAGKNVTAAYVASRRAAVSWPPSSRIRASSR